MAILIQERFEDLLDLPSAKNENRIRGILSIESLFLAFLS